MKRFIFKLAIFLVLGAIINVAVAWGCAATSEAPDIFTKADANSSISSRDRAVARTANATCDEELPVEVTNHFGVTYRVIPIVDEAFWAQMRKLQEDGFGFASFITPSVLSKSCGFPARAMDGSAIMGSYDLLTRDRLGLPYRPLWPGFAINTIFYAAILWMLLAVPGYLKRRRRIKRGLCVKCAYPVSVTSAVCSECGTPVHPRHGAAAPCNPCLESRR